MANGLSIDLAGHLLGHRHFIPDLGLGRDDRGLRGAAGQHRQQMPLITVSVFGAPHCLAIQPDRHQPRRALLARGVIPGGRLAGQSAHQPAAHGRVEEPCVSVGDHPSDRRLRRRAAPGGHRPACAGPPARGGRGVPDPAEDRRITLHSRHDRGCG